MEGGEYMSAMENMDPTLSELGDEFTLGDIDEMLQFVSNQVGDFPDLFEDQMAQGSLQSGAGAAPRPPPQTPQTPQTATLSPAPPPAPTPAPAPQSLPLTPPQTPVQVASSGQHQLRSPPLLQPRPPLAQQIQPTLQVQTQAIPVQAQALTVHTQSFPVQAQALPVQTQAQTVMFAPTLTTTSQSRFIQSQVICHQSPTTGFQVLQPQMQSIVTSPQVQPMTIQHQRVLTQAGQTIQTLSTAPTTVHTMSPQMQQVQQVQHVPTALQYGVAQWFSTGGLWVVHSRPIQFLYCPAS